MKGQKLKGCQKIVAIILVLAMTFTMVFTFTGCSGGEVQNGITPKLRINEETLYWEVSYDEGKTWESMEVCAVGPVGEDGKDGVNGTNGENGTDGVDGINGIDGVNGKDGADGKNGINGTNGKDGQDGADGKDGQDGKDGADGNGASMEDIMRIIEDYETFKTVAPLMKNVNFGRANCQGTTNCFNSSFYRILTDDHKFYDGASVIANYLKGVFVEGADGKVSVNMSSPLGRVSYTDALTMINFASAFSSYNEYIVRNNMTMPSDIAAQKELAIKYFNTVDYTASGYHKKTGGAGLTYPSRAVAVVAMGSLLGQKDTVRFETLIKNAYENVDSAFWGASTYLDPMYMLCADYNWFDKAKLPKISTSTPLTDANILLYYGYGINLAKDYADLWTDWAEDALSDNALDAAEAKAFAYHYAYQIADGDVDLGVYGSSRAIVDFSKYQ